MGAVSIKRIKQSDLFLSLALVVALVINILIIEQVMSRAYVNLGLFIAAAGAFVRQLTHQAAGRASSSKPNARQSEAEPEKERKTGRAGTAAWYGLLTLWAVSMAFVLFFR